MIAPVRCSACHNDVNTPVGSFFLTVKAEQATFCDHCHQHLPGKDVNWHFCSTKCFTRLQPCKACWGGGYTWKMHGEDNARTTETCEACKGVGLAIAL